MSKLTRRNLFAAASGVAASGLLTAGSLHALAGTQEDPAAAARDTAYWGRVRDLHDITGELIHLEHGNWGMMARPVLEAYKSAIDRVNSQTSLYARREFAGDLQAILKLTAQTIGADEDEIVFTRNATEAMQALISGYNRLHPGDSVLFADLDYPAMQTAMTWLTARRGVSIVKIALPEPAGHTEILQSYRRALEENPSIRLVLLTHVSHRTGLVLPVRELTALIRSRGAEVLLDSAHALGQVAFEVSETGADFIGLNLHKWIGAPLGVGALYIRRGRTGAIDAYMNAEDPQPEGTNARVHTGTVNLAALLAVPDALALHEAIGPARKQARLQYLRSLWAEEMRSSEGIEILTPADDRLFAGITSFRLSGRTSREQNIALARRLSDEFGIFTVMRDGLASGACVRVTPAVFTLSDEIERLIFALKTILKTPG